jgi:hypothetical protein
VERLAEKNTRRKMAVSRFPFAGIGGNVTTGKRVPQTVQSLPQVYNLKGFDSTRPVFFINDPNFESFFPVAARAGCVFG